MDPLIKSKRLKCSGLAQTSNTTERTGFSAQSEQYLHSIPGVRCTSPGDRRTSGSCPAGLVAEVGLRWWRRLTPLNRKEIPMSAPKSKRRTPARPSSKTAGRNAAQMTARETAKRKAGTQSTVEQQHRSSTQQTGRGGSKQARIIAMLRAPSGATIDAMVHATGWQTFGPRFPRRHHPQKARP